MGQQEFDNFKQIIKRWKDEHPKEYTDFVEQINNGSAYQKIYDFAKGTVPHYDEATKQRIYDDTQTDFSNLENLLTDTNIAQQLVNELQNPNQDSIVFPMLAWLYFGQSYENMVEKGETLIKDTRTDTTSKWVLSSLIKHIINKSIINMRAITDWHIFKKRQKAIENNSITEWAIEDKETKQEPETTESPISLDPLSQKAPKKPGRKPHNETLSELILPHCNKELLIEKIGTRLKFQSSSIDIARLKIALIECGFMSADCFLTTFRNALEQQYNGIKITDIRGIQKEYSRLLTTTPDHKQIKDTGADQKAISELKEYLSK